MFETIGQLAEHTADKASRREVLGGLGRAALLTASGLAGLLALPGVADAARKPPYLCPGDSYTGCIGKAEGSTCLGSFGVSGTCRRYRKSTTCYCV